MEPAFFGITSLTLFGSKVKGKAPLSRLRLISDDAASVSVYVIGAMLHAFAGSSHSIPGSTLRSTCSVTVPNEKWKV